MRRSDHIVVILCLTFVLAFSRPLFPDVVSYSAYDDEGSMVLSSVSVRGREGDVTIFAADKLIPVRVTAFRSEGCLVVVVPSGCGLPRGEIGPGLLDRVLNSGLSNPAPRRPEPAGTATPADSMGLVVRFARPVVNRPGDDLVLFELHTSVNSPDGGDPFLISVVGDAGQSGFLRVDAFDVTLSDPHAKPILSCEFYATPSPPENLQAISTASLRPSGNSDSMPFKVLAVGVDLSDLDIPEGDAVNEAWLVNVPERKAAVDFVCIAGLPEALPENVLAKEPERVKAPPPPVLAPLLDGVLRDVEQLVFAVRRPGTDHWYANFGFYSAPTSEYPPQRAANGKVTLPPIYKDGGSLRLLNIRDGTVSVLLDDPKGAIRDPCVAYDGRTILFSWRPAGTDFYHLFRVCADGSDLQQITSGPHNDIEPAVLPDGGIVFCSDRCNRFVNCWRTPVATLYRCEADGSGLRMISSNIEHDNTPWMLPDGRILYMRWEYVDRNQNVFHHLWTAAPDGSGQMVFFGNMHPGTAMLDAKPIPGTSLVAASFSPGHGRAEHAGHITIVDPRQGPDDLPSVRRISRGAPVYRDPFPVSEDAFFVAAERRLLIMDGRGRCEELYALPDAEKGTWVHEPRPLVPHVREPVIPSRTSLASKTGTLFLSDVVCGRNMAGVERGEITRLLVLEQLPKPVNFSGGMWPISAGGTFTLARVLGTVPVAEDGSAVFEVPALRSLFFVALDARGMSVKRMHSFTTVQPGETMGCVGCHEARTNAPLSELPRSQAAQRKPDSITPVPGVPDVPDFPRDIQPILDAHCIRCHNPSEFKAGLDLTGDRTPLFSQAYWALTQRGLYSDGRNAMRSNFSPRTIGSGASQLLKQMDGHHHDVSPSQVQRDTVRTWIDAGAPFAGTYAALGSGFSTVEFPEDVFERRCASCHGKEAGAKPIGGRKTVYRFGSQGSYLPLVHTHGNLRDIRARLGYFKFGQARTPQSLCNLSNPALSLLLRAPLAETAGGLALCGGRVFETTADPDYVTILHAIERAAERLSREKRFDMPDFRPNDYYLFQLVRYGILDRMPADGPLDPYPLDRLYWASFHWSAVSP